MPKSKSKIFGACAIVGVVTAAAVYCRNHRFRKDE